MWIDVALDHFSATKKRPKVWIAVDVLRATSVMTTFLSEGGKQLYMAGSVEQARALQRDLKLLAIGEQFAKPIPGFDFDNSPLELLLHKEKLNGRSGVHCTSNGTKLAKLLISLGGVVIAGSFLNLTACVERAIALCAQPTPPGPPLEEEPSDGIASSDPDGIVVACAGRSTLPVLDDTYLAGAIVERLRALLPQAELRDTGTIALALPRTMSAEEAFRLSESGRVMASLGLQEEMLFCTQRDVYRCVPEATIEGDLLVMRPAEKTSNAASQEGGVLQC